MFGLTYIQFDIICLRILTDYHTGVNLLARSYKEDAALLCVEQAVAHALARLEGDKGAGVQ